MAKAVRNLEHLEVHSLESQGYQSRKNGQADLNQSDRPLLRRCLHPLHESPGQFERRLLIDWPLSVWKRSLVLQNCTGTSQALKALNCSMCAAVLYKKQKGNTKQSVK
ncbi:hypothetical protein DPMN_067991 [Dreissena polymorpha]|uniref:Uncharacterized protein n=1 Tax=Dreissena polymorpha TaxID=45954 RepID=A0A9D3YWS3_DREPO|nr:hypothetical protein DPMN_067991 [Dreissena polymorpha]